MDAGRIYNSEIMLYRSQKNSEPEKAGQNSEASEIEEVKLYNDSLDLSQKQMIEEKFLENTNQILAKISQYEDEKLQDISTRIKTGYYQQEDVLSDTLDKMIDELSI